MGMLPLFIGKPGKVHSPVVGIKIEQHAAGAQHPQPLRIGRLGIRQRPGQVAGQDAVKGRILKIQLGGTHAAPVHRAACLIGQCGGLGEHPLAQIDARDLAARLCQQDGKKSRARAQIQYAQGGPVFPARQPGQDLRPPQGGLVTLQFLTAYLPESVGTPGPVTPDAPVEPGPGLNSIPGDAGSLLHHVLLYGAVRVSAALASGPSFSLRHDHEILPVSWTGCGRSFPAGAVPQNLQPPCRHARRMLYGGGPCAPVVQTFAAPGALPVPAASSQLPSHAARKGTTVSSIRRKRGLRALPSCDTGRCSAQRP